MPDTVTESKPNRTHLVVAIALLLITLAVNVAMPLFRVYAAASHLNNGQTSLVFAVYILGMLPCYVFLGGLSDRVGRKPILVISLLFSMLATLTITVWPTVQSLAFARFFQGVGVGLGMGAGTAYMSELLHPHPRAATAAANHASLFTSLGFGGGALATSIALLIHFSLRPFTYFILIGLSIIGLILLLVIPESKPTGGALIRLPYFPKGAAPVNMAIAICWAATGVIIAIIPTQLAKFELTAYAGFCLVLVNWTGAFIQPLLRKKRPLQLVRTGLWLVPLGFAVVITGCYYGWLPVILIGTSIVGMAAYGYSYLGGLALITTLGDKHKARAVSGYMFTGYVGFGIPAVCLGYFADRFQIINALLVFELAVVVLSAALFFVFARRK